MSATRSVAVITHRRVKETAGAVRGLIAAGPGPGVTLSFSEEEAAKHGLSAGDGIEIRELSHDADLCVVLGGDGTILTALRHYVGTGVPVFAVNYGEVGFLATIDPDGSDGAEGEFDRAFAGDYETLELPTITVGRPDAQWTALNDISVHRQPGHARRRPLLWAGGRGDRTRPLRRPVVATPQGSTGYNLANAGPVLAWGVAGYVVSFIAPHSLTARALVVAPDDLLTINNASRDEPVEVHVDGRPACELPAGGEDIRIEFGRSFGTLAQLPGASFYHRLRERFGRLARRGRAARALLAPAVRRVLATGCWVASLAAFLGPGVFRALNRQ
jgi:NAD+ kinase